MVSSGVNGNVTTATTLSNSQSPLNSQNNLHHNHNNLSIGNVGTIKEKEVIQGKISSQPSHDSDSDYGPPAIPPSTSNNRSRQKKFMKTFSQLPQEEVVLQSKCFYLTSDDFFVFSFVFLSLSIILFSYQGAPCYFKSKWIFMHQLLIRFSEIIKWGHGWTIRYWKQWTWFNLLVLLPCYFHFKKHDLHACLR